MKKIYLIILICILVAQCYAQTAHFILSEDSVTCEIPDSDGNIIKSDKGILDYTQEIKVIKFTEKEDLKNLTPHSFIIGGKPLEFISGKTTINGMKSAKNELSTPITLTRGDVITVKRGDDEIGKIEVKPYSLKEKGDKIKIKSSVKSSDKKTPPFTFRKKECETFKFRLSSIPQDITVTNVKIDCYGKKISCDFDENEKEITFEIDPTTLQKDKKYPVKCYLTIQDNKNKNKNKVIDKGEIITVISPFDSELPWWRKHINYVIAILSLICCLYFFIRRPHHTIKEKSNPNDGIANEKIKYELANAKRELEIRPTRQEYVVLSQKLKETIQKLKETEQKLQETEQRKDKEICEAMEKARADEKKRLEAIHKKDIIDNYIPIAIHKQKLLIRYNKVRKAIKAKEESDKALKQKEADLTIANGKISDLETDILNKKTEIIRLKAVIAKLKEAAQKKNVHFVYQVQETLEEISNTFKDVYKDMTNTTIKDGFISPMLNGVSGLGVGIMSWAEDFTVKVKGNSEEFFGGDFMTMNEEDVKETISRKFISNIVKSDSFSKFVRLYYLSNIPFIRKQFVDAGMNIDVLYKLYYKVYVLVSEFGYQIICPRLFEEQYSEKKYKWFNSTNLFNIINLPEEEKSAIKELGSETIIDVNQIGFISPWASRNATAVTPDF
jgi:hypothetical protein